MTCKTKNFIRTYRFLLLPWSSDLSASRLREYLDSAASPWAPVCWSNRHYWCQATEKHNSAPPRLYRWVIFCRPTVDASTRHWRTDDRLMWMRTIWWLMMRLYLDYPCCRTSAWTTEWTMIGMSCSAWGRMKTGYCSGPICFRTCCRFCSQPISCSTYWPDSRPAMCALAWSTGRRLRWIGALAPCSHPDWSVCRPPAACFSFRSPRSRCWWTWFLVPRSRLPNRSVQSRTSCSLDSGRRPDEPNCLDCLAGGCASRARGRHSSGDLSANRSADLVSCPNAPALDSRCTWPA